MRTKGYLTTRAALGPIVLAFLVWLVTSMGWAGTTGKIAGVARDAQTKEPLIGVNIIIEGTAQGAATNLEGYYVILNVSPGKYTVVASAIGYHRKIVTEVAVFVDLTTTVDFQLEPAVIELDEEVVITAERPVIQRDLTSSEARVTGAQISSLPVREVREVLALQAGITIGRDGAIHIRGGRASEVAYWVDGVSLSDVYDGTQAVQVDNRSVQELQVVSGTFNAEYGQAMSGIINIVTRDGDQQFRGSLSSYVGGYRTSGSGTFYNLDEYRPFDNRNFEGSLSGPFPGIADLTFYASARYFKTDGWLFGNRAFKTDGSFAPGTDSLKDAGGNLIGVKLPNNPVPMNGRQRMSGQVKLTYRFTPLMRLSLTGLGSDIEYRDYSHGWRLNPDGDVKKFDRGYSLTGQWNHTLSSSAFYTVHVSYFFKNFREYLYEDPFDPRYNLDPNALNTALYEFIRQGTNLHQFKRTTETRSIKADYTNQINHLHQVRAGVEGKLHRLYLEDYYITPEQKTIIEDTVSRNIYVATIPDPFGPLYEEYTEKPVEFSAYVQDKLEYESMIVNVGVRFDYFNSKGKILADASDPNVYLPRRPENQALSLKERLLKWYKKASPKYSVSPRLGIAYPITDRGVLHFSYGHFLKIPSFIHLYQRPGYKVTTASGLQGVYGNPDLNPEKTVMYEIGLQQQLSNVLSFDVTGFYRDTRDWVTTSTQIPVGDPETATTYYTIFVNRDYANSRGITLTVNKRPTGDLLSLNFAYTFQVAEGNNSHPDEEQAAQRDNREPARALTPLEWDQTHTVNLTLGVGEPDWGVFLLARYGSGLPYTPVINQAEARGEDASRAVQKNSRRRPATYTVDLRAFKSVQLGPLDLSFFVKILNLFDQRNEIDVYGQTGRASATPRALGVAAVGGGYRVNSVEEYLVRPDFFSEPREIQFGVELNF